MTPEGKLQQDIIRYARGLGILAKRNYNGPGVATGWPDLELFFPGGKVVLAEIKAPGKKSRVTKKQQHRIRQLHALGHEAHVWDDLDEARSAIDKALSAQA